MTDREQHYKQTVFGIKGKNEPVAKMEDDFKFKVAKYELMTSEVFTTEFGMRQPTEGELIAFYLGYNYAVKRIALLTQVKIAEEGK